MSIKPMAFIDDAGLYALQHNASAKVWSVPAEKETPLFAIPDTHRVVSVDLLEKCVGQLLYGAKAHQSLNDELGNSSRVAPGRIACETLSDELSAIIDNTPQ